MNDLTSPLAVLRAGELLAIPTETVYGLAADASNAAAVQKIYRLKGRPSSRPLIVHIAAAENIDEWAIEVPAYARRWADAFWPGPLAMVFQRRATVQDAVTGGQDSVALRVPNHPLTLQLLREFSGGLAAPSANRYGRISPTTAAHVHSEFGEDTPLVLDGGPCQVGIESTIVACLDDAPVILRPGSVSAVDLARIGEVDVTIGGADAKVVVPGQVASHYAPETPARLLAYGDMQHWSAPEGPVGFLGFHAPPFGVQEQILMSKSPDEAARQLYSALRTLDATDVDHILIEAPPGDAAWSGVLDRLQRAAA